MRWRSGRRSTNVEDRRRVRVTRKAAGGGIGIVVIALIAMYFGVDPSIFLSQLGPTSSVSTQQTTRNIPAAENELAEFVSVVLADTEDTWNEIFAQAGLQYQEPTLVLFRDSVRSACGFAQAAMGPFYCPADSQVYIDLAFFDQLARRFGAPGDFAQAYVIAHEVGHHVQNLLGTSDKVHRMRGRPDYNEWSVRLELQADFYAGVWARHNREYLDRGDIQEAMTAANAIGDDAIQGRMQGKIVPHTFTHGTSEQRARWFDTGFDSGQVSSCDTFAARQL